MAGRAGGGDHRRGPRPGVDRGRVRLPAGRVPRQELRRRARSTGTSATIKSLVDSRRIYIIPMLNPDGNNQTVFGWGLNDRNWRKNRRPLPYWGSEWIPALVPAGPPNPPTQPFANVQQTMMLWTRFDVPDYNPAGGVPAGAAPGAPAGVAPTFQTRTLSNGNTGVDVNRNMATTGWGYDPPPGGDWNPADDSFFGTAPGGETEAANVAAAMAAAAAAPVAAGNISVALDYHSYSRVILYPSEQVFSAGGVNAIAPPYQRVGDTLQSLIVDAAGGHYDLGSASVLHRLRRDRHDRRPCGADAPARAFTIELDPRGTVQRVPATGKPDPERLREEHPRRAGGDRGTGPAWRTYTLSGSTATDPGDRARPREINVPLRQPAAAVRGEHTCRARSILQELLTELSNARDGTTLVLDQATLGQTSAAAPARPVHQRAPDHLVHAGRRPAAGVGHRRRAGHVSGHDPNVDAGPDVHRQATARSRSTPLF